MHNMRISPTTPAIAREATRAEGGLKFLAEEAVTEVPNVSVQ
jgi:hypothetical protein